MCRATGTSVPISLPVMVIHQRTLDLLWDFSDPETSERRLRAAAETEQDAEDRAELQTQVARALGLQGRLAEAEALLEALAVDSAAVRTRVLLERGRVLNSGGAPEEAVPLFLEAADAAASADLDFLRVDALHMLAIADADDAERWTGAALAVLDGVDDPRTLRWRVSLHNNLGWSLLDDGRTAEAVTEFERAKDAAVRWGTPQQVEWADEALAEARASLEAGGR